MSGVRLDRYLAQSGERTRSEAVRAIRAGLAAINGAAVRDPAVKVGQGDMPHAKDAKKNTGVFVDPAAPKTGATQP